MLKIEKICPKNYEFSTVKKLENYFYPILNLVEKRKTLIESIPAVSFL